MQYRHSILSAHICWLCRITFISFSMSNCSSCSHASNSTSSYSLATTIPSRLCVCVCVCVESRWDWSLWIEPWWRKGGYIEGEGERYLHGVAVPRVEVPAHHGRGKVSAQFSSNTLDTLDCREMFNLTGEFKTLGNIVLYMLCMLPWLHQLTFNVACSRGEHGWLE